MPCDLSFHYIQSLIGTLVVSQYQLYDVQCFVLHQTWNKKVIIFPQSKLSERQLLCISVWYVSVRFAFFKDETQLPGESSEILSGWHEYYLHGHLDGIWQNGFDTL